MRAPVGTSEIENGGKVNDDGKGGEETRETDQDGKKGQGAVLPPDAGSSPLHAPVPTMPLSGVHILEFPVGAEGPTDAGSNMGVVRSEKMR